jgi:hypothetical protein
MLMTENDDFDSDSTDSESTDWEALFDDLRPSTVLEDFEPLVTVPRPPCDACDTEYHDGLTDVPLGEETYDVCESCLDHLIDVIERYYWYDRLTEAHYNRAAEYLRSLDEVWCVKDHAYPGGEMWVHTPYCDAAVVNDVCDHFGFRIRWFSIVEPDDHEFDCVHDHGPCVEINLDFPSHRGDPMPLEYDLIDDVSYHDVEWVEAHTRLFNRDG